MMILFDARPIVDAPYGGVGRVAIQRALFFLEQPDVQVLFFTTGRQPANLPEKLKNHPHARTIHIHLPNKLWSLLCILGFRPLGWCIKQKPDLVYLPNLGFAGIPKNWKSELLMHDVSFLIEPKWFRLKQRLWHVFVRPKKLAQEASIVSCVSTRTAKDTEIYLGVAPTKLQSISIEPTLTVPPQLISKDPHKRIILAFGAMDPRKNFATAEFAVNALKKESGFENLELVAIGRDVQPTDEELAELYQKASALLYPSWYEGFGLPLHEAAFYNCPRIASTAGALPETAPPGTIFVNPAKPHHWVEALRIILTKTEQ